MIKYKNITNKEITQNNFINDKINLVKINPNIKKTMIRNKYKEIIY